MSFFTIRRIQAQIAVLIMLGCCLFLAGGHSAGAATTDTTWTGKVSTNWDDAGNWDNGVPTAGDGFKAIVPGYLERNPIIAKSGSQVGNSLTILSGAKLVLNGDLEVNGAIIIDVGGEIQVGEGAVLKSYGNYNWIVNGTLLLQPDSTAWLEPTENACGSIVLTKSGSLVARGNQEKPITIKGSPYPRTMKNLSIQGSTNIIMEYVTMFNVQTGIGVSVTPKGSRLSNLKLGGGSLFSIDAWSSAKLVVYDSELFSSLNLYSNAAVELVRCNLNSKEPLFHVKLDKGWVISREDVQNKGAYIYWAGSKGCNWHAGSVAPTANDDVILKDNRWTESDCVILDADAVCRNLTIDKGAKLVVSKGAKLVVYGSVTNNGKIEAEPDAIVKANENVTDQTKK
ncbi:MAG: hypothetical protein PHO05_06975 [bacterium]|nr:hypothetical protein [bacterium]